MKTRFAPSPTGFLHIGTVRTALFNYLFAKKNKGSFLLRIEDTDKERSKTEFENNILEALKWLNIDFDEGPYRQSERGEIYEKYLKKLLDEKKAYYCFCSKEELEAKKQNYAVNGLPVKYDGKCSSLSREEAEKKLKRGEMSVIRMKMPEEKIEVKDLIRGKIIFDTKLIGDIVIAKNLKSPLYNFSVVIDDYEMKITHVLRGEDILSNTPKQIVLCNHLGINPPKYGHMPMILGTDKSKLSKRHGATAVLDYKKEGYLKEALINFLAFLGWSPKDKREFFEIEELIEEFSLERMNKSGAVFNLKKLDYINGHYIRKKSIDEITEFCIPYLVEKEYITPIFKDREIIPNLTGIAGKEISMSFIIKKTKEEISFEYLKNVVSLYKERMKKLSEIADFTDYVFKKDLSFNKELLQWKGSKKEEMSFVLTELFKILNSLKNWDSKTIEEEIMPFAERYKTGDRGYVLWPLRVALTGKKSSAGPFDVASVLGKEKTLRRINAAIKMT
ncbi:MAG: glutamate--tRNA ligase [Candidatus Paceibacterota bacterium]